MRISRSFSPANARRTEPYSRGGEVVGSNANPSTSVTETFPRGPFTLPIPEPIAVKRPSVFQSSRTKTPPFAA